MPYALLRDLSIKEIDITHQDFGWCIDSAGVRHAAPRVHSSREAAMAQGRALLRHQEQVFAQSLTLHERRKANVADY